jgi:hypothetical protein
MVVAFSGILRRRLVTIGRRGLVGGAEGRGGRAGSSRCLVGRMQAEKNVQVRRLYPPLLSDSCTVLLAVITCLLGEAAAAK